MSDRSPLAALVAVALLVWALPASATSEFHNRIVPSPGVSFAGPWTFSHVNGFASSQGTPSGDGPDLAVHAFASSGPGTSIAFESSIWADFQITGVSGFPAIPVHIGGTYILELCGQGIVQVEAWLCQGLLNACKVNPTRIILAVDGINSNLSPTNQSKVETYGWDGELFANVAYTLRMRVVASAVEPSTLARSFIDPAFTLGTSAAIPSQHGSSSGTGTPSKGRRRTSVSRGARPRGAAA